MGKTAQIVNALDKCITKIIKIALYFGMAAVVAMMLITVIHAVGRYTIATPVPGIIELSGYLLVTAVFLIGAYAMLQKRHISIGIIVDRLSERKQAIIESVTFIISLIFIFAASWQTFFRASYIMKQGQASAILHIPNSPFYYMVAVGWVLFGLAILVQLVHSIGRAVKK